jgi:ankyrin repeat protein
MTEIKDNERLLNVLNLDEQQMSKKLTKIILYKSPKIDDIISFLHESPPSSRPQQNVNYLNTLTKISGTTFGRELLMTPLMAASQLHYIDIVRLLIRTGADVNCIDVSSKSALSYAIIGLTKNKQWRDQTIELLIELTNERIVDLNAVLFLAIEYHDINAVKLLIEQRGLNINSLNKYGNSALMYTREVEIGSYLIANGIDLNRGSSKSGLTPLMSYFTGEEVKLALIEAGANVFWRDKTGKTALEYAFEGSELKCVKILIKKYLEQVFIYFSTLTPVEIRANMRKFIMNNKENASSTALLAFPIQNYHIYALNVLRRCLVARARDDVDLNLGLSDSSEFDFLFYLVGVEFEEKLWSDVIGMLWRENVEIDGQLLVGRLVRSKDEKERRGINELMDRLDEWRKLAEDFGRIVGEMKNEILNMVRKVTFN